MFLEVIPCLVKKRLSEFCTEKGTGAKSRQVRAEGLQVGEGGPQNRFTSYTVSIYLPNLSSSFRLDPHYVDNRNSGLTPDVFLCFPTEVFYHSVKQLFIKLFSLYLIIA